MRRGELYCNGGGSIQHRCKLVPLMKFRKCVSFLTPIFPPAPVFTVLPTILPTNCMNHSVCHSYRTLLIFWKSKAHLWLVGDDNGQVEWEYGFGWYGRGWVVKYSERLTGVSRSYQYWCISWEEFYPLKMTLAGVPFIFYSILPN